MSKIVDVSDKSEEGIKKALTQIYAIIGIPAGYTDDIDKQLHILVKDPNIQHVNQALLSLLVVMNKLQKDKPERLSLAIEQIETGNIDDSLINELGTFILANMPNVPPSDPNLNIGVIEFLKDSGAVAPRLIEEVERMNGDALSTDVIQKKRRCSGNSYCNCSRFGNFGHFWLSQRNFKCSIKCI